MERFVATILSAQHSVATLVKHYFELFLHRANMFCPKNRK